MGGCVYTQAVSGRRSFNKFFFYASRIDILFDCINKAYLCDSLSLSLKMEEDMRYLRHLYVSMGKIVTASTREKPVDLLEAEFDYYTERRIPLLIEWLDTQIVFTRERSENLPTDSRVLVGAWEFLKVVVIHSQYQVLKEMWDIYSHFGAKESEHDQFSWHLSAILYHWIREGTRGGLIGVNPHQRYLNGEVEDTLVLRDICIQLKNLQCFLNLTGEEASQLLVHKAKSIEKPVYLFRLSATIPGVIVMQCVLYGLKKKKDTSTIINVRLGEKTLGKDYSFFMSPLEYSIACEVIMAKYYRAVSRTMEPLIPDMVLLKPTWREMVGYTKGYGNYYDVRVKSDAPTRELKGEYY